MARSTAVRSFGLAAAAGAGVAGAGAWYVAQPERQSNSRTAKRDARRMKDLLGGGGIISRSSGKPLDDVPQTNRFLREGSPCHPTPSRISVRASSPSRTGCREV